MAMAKTKPNSAYLDEHGELRVPLTISKRSRKTNVEYLAALNAPLKTWMRHAYEGNLTEKAHRSYCKGEAGEGDGFKYCTTCARYQED